MKKKAFWFICCAFLMCAILVSCKGETYTTYWYDYDGVTLLQTENIKVGEEGIFTGEEPVRESDTEFHYDFAGWERFDESVVGGYVKMRALYTTRNRFYYIIWKNYDGETLGITSVKYGEEAICPFDIPEGETPLHIFTGWKGGDLSSVTEDITFTAQFELYKPSPVSIQVIAYPTYSTQTSSFSIGQPFTSEGLIVLILYDNGFEYFPLLGELEIDYSSFDNTKEGFCEITVSLKQYPDVKTSYKVSVGNPANSLVSISVQTLPTKVDYDRGEPFDATGLEVFATYADGTVLSYWQYSVDMGFYNSQIDGVYEIIVISLQNSSISVSFPVTVKGALDVDRLGFSNYKDEYELGETFDSRVTVTIFTTELSGSITVELDITEYEIDAKLFNPNVAGTYSIFVTHIESGVKGMFQVIVGDLSGEDIG